MRDSKELIEYKRELPVISEPASRERCKAVPVKRESKLRELFAVLASLWKFCALFAAFTAVFTTVYALSPEFSFESTGGTAPPMSGNQSSEEIEELEPSVTAGASEETPIIINEARIDEAIDLLIAGYDKAPPVFKLDRDVSVAVIHAHSSEKVSDGMTALEAGEVLAQLLSSAGVGAVHIDEIHDREGKLGAYDRTVESIGKAREKYGGLMMIIDLHGSESDAPVSFSVGVEDGVGWQENLRVAYAVATELERERPVIRLIPGDLGQHSGIITVSVAIGHPEASEDEARRLLGDVSVAVVMLFKEKIPE